MERPTPEEISATFDDGSALERPCMVENCVEEGIYRAPKSPSQLREYYWFCLDHIRDYNSAWDYFSGMNEAEIDRQVRNDMVWQRPSWPFAGAAAQTAAQRAEAFFRDDFGFFSRDRRNGAPQAPRSDKDKALAALNLGSDASFETVKGRYKELVKELHPDANGGNAEAEERLKTINQAYGTLKGRFAA